MDSTRNSSKNVELRKYDQLQNRLLSNELKELEMIRLRRVRSSKYWNNIKNNILIINLSYAALEWLLW